MSRLFLALLIMLSSACSVAPKQIALHDFGVRPNPIVTGGLYPSLQATDIKTKADITVDTPLWLINDCIYYRLLYASPTQLRCYNLDKWIAPPAELFKQQLLASGQFSKHRLIIHLLDFEQQFDTAQQARVILHFVVDAYALDAERPFATKDFYLQQTTATADAAGAVTGFAHLTQQAGNQVQRWLLTY